MFKRALGIITLIGLLNVLLSFHQKNVNDAAHHKVYSGTSHSLIGFVFNIFDGNAGENASFPQKTKTRYLPAYSFHISFPAASFPRLKIAEENLLCFEKMVYPHKQISINLLPENQNYLFRLKPF